ncbi:hypothetical protein [Nocardiopsis kunsanensis]|uniref:SdpI family protein n=1 Tax=Nocardiopsis kunsanensis TaxID=141693 RepID=A0A918XDP3_9ACTN|nr:hypothetical protein [Nocardiopsis kunsanensis]GHD26233.1 hypothetical protein GCM10007147_24120 [Nocardiopsis kunsanensis]
MTSWLTIAFVYAVLAGALLWSAGRPVSEDGQGRLRTFVQLPPGIVTREQAEAYRRRLHPHLAAASYVLSAAAPGTALWALLADDPGDPVPVLLGICLTTVVITGMGQVRASLEVGDHTR